MTESPRVVGEGKRRMSSVNRATTVVLLALLALAVVLIGWFALQLYLAAIV